MCDCITTRMNIEIFKMKKKTPSSLPSDDRKFMKLKIIPEFAARN